MSKPIFVQAHQSYCIRVLTNLIDIGSVCTKGHILWMALQHKDLGNMFKP